AAAYAVVGLAWLLRHALDLNLLAAGEENALQLGVDVERARRAGFVAASLLVGAAVAVGGGVGFVGVGGSPLLRLLLGPDHRLLLPASFLGGAAFLVWADTLARTILGPAELPVGVVTALTGGPFFLYLLHRDLRRALARRPPPAPHSGSLSSGARRAPPAVGPPPRSRGSLARAE